MAPALMAVAAVFVGVLSQPKPAGDAAAAAIVVLVVAVGAVGAGLSQPKPAISAVGAEAVAVETATSPAAAMKKPNFDMTVPTFLHEGCSGFHRRFFVLCCFRCFPLH